MKSNLNNKNKSVIFLDEGQELKIVLTTIPHSQVYIKNENGILKISKNYPFEKITKKDGC